MRSFLCLTLLASLPACTRPNAELDSPCAKLTTRDACEGTAGCAVFACTTGGFTLCYDPSEPIKGQLCTVDCASLDEASCEANGACAVEACCGSFTTCYPAGAEPPACTEDCAPPVCSTHTDEASCDADPNCAALDCCGSFEQCYERQGAPPPACPAICPATCSAYLDEASCNAASGCYSTFEPTSCTGLTCTYAFSHCDAGGPVCTAPQECTTDQPTPNCVAPYAPDYEPDGCYSDCVLASACQ